MKDIKGKRWPVLTNCSYQGLHLTWLRSGIVEGLSELTWGILFSSRIGNGELIWGILFSSRIGNQWWADILKCSFHGSGLLHILEGYASYATSGEPITSDGTSFRHTPTFVSSGAIKKKENDV
jgi:hypothetical protein